MVSRADLGNFLSTLFNMFQAPQLFHIGDDAAQHMDKIQKYLIDIKVENNQERIRIFFNSLEQDAQYEIFSLPDYAVFKDNFDEIKGKFLELYKCKESKVSPIIDLLKFNQNNLSLREYMTKLRVELYKTRPSLCSEE